MAIEKQIWSDILMEGFYPDNSFLAHSVDMTPLVEYNQINLAEAGVAPDVLIDNNVFPVPTMSRTDIPLNLPLHTFDTKNTVVRNIEEMETSYNKMDSVVRQHRNTLQAKVAAYAAYNWAPSKQATLTPVSATTGAVNKQSVKALTFEDVLNMDAWFRAQDVNPATLICVINPYHFADLQLEDMKLYKTILETGKLFGFTVFNSTALPYYNATTGVKTAFGTNAATDTQATLFYSSNEVMRADGTVEVFAKYKDPEQRGDIVGFQKRFTALPIRGKYQAAIYSAKSA